MKNNIQAQQSMINRTIILYIGSTTGATTGAVIRVHKTGVFNMSMMTNPGCVITVIVGCSMYVFTWLLMQMTHDMSARNQLAVAQ